MQHTELAIRTLLTDLAALQEHANEVACDVILLRTNRPPGSTPRASLSDCLEDGVIQAEWHQHSNDHFVDFPLEYLWLDDQAIAAAEQARVDKIRLKAAEDAEIKRLGEVEARRQRYLALKQEFEPEPPPEAPAEVPHLTPDSSLQQIVMHSAGYHDACGGVIP